MKPYHTPYDEAWRQWRAGQRAQKKAQRIMWAATLALAALDVLIAVMGW